MRDLKILELYLSGRGYDYIFYKGAKIGENWVEITCEYRHTNSFRKNLQEICKEQKWVAVICYDLENVTELADALVMKSYPDFSGSEFPIIYLMHRVEPIENCIDKLDFTTYEMKGRKFQLITNVNKEK